MSLLMYAVTEAPAREIRGTGLRGARLGGVEERGLVAIVSEGDGSSIEASEEALWEYEQALERLMARHVILPARFASILADETETRAMIGRRYGELIAALDRVRGAVELGISVGWRDGAETSAEPPGSGTEYLLGRLALQRRASAIARGLDPLAALARSSRLRVLPRGALPVTGSYLVDRSRANEFLRLVADLDAGLHEADVVCTGPWPPYSFVEGVPG
jgi:hypothetical protein